MIEHLAKIILDRTHYIAWDIPLHQSEDIFRRDLGISKQGNCKDEKREKGEKEIEGELGRKVQRAIFADAIQNFVPKVKEPVDCHLLVQLELP